MTELIDPELFEEAAAMALLPELAAAYQRWRGFCLPAAAGQCDEKPSGKQEAVVQTFDQLETARKSIESALNNVTLTQSQRQMLRGARSAVEYVRDRLPLAAVDVRLEQLSEGDRA